MARGSVTHAQAILILKHEDEEFHESMIKRLINEYDEYSASCEGDGTDSTGTDEYNKLLTESDLDDLYSCLIDMENMDKNTTARKYPIKDTPTLKAPIKKILPSENTLSIRKWTH